MNATVSQKIKIGIFTLAGVLALAGGIFAIGNRKNIFGSTFEVHGSFRNIGGLQIGNNVRFDGINVGNVDRIGLDNDSTVRITMRLKSSVTPFLKSDAVAAIGSDGLMGDKLINITPGDGSGKLIANGGEIATAEPVDFDHIIKRISNVADNAEVITSSLANIANHISSGKGSLGKLIYTDTLERGLESTVREAKQTMSSAKAGVAGFSENMTAMKHNFLLRGYYKHQEREHKEQADSASGNSRAARRVERRDERKEKREEKRQH